MGAVCGDRCATAGNNEGMVDKVVMVGGECWWSNCGDRYGNDGGGGRAGNIGGRTDDAYGGRRRNASWRGEDSELASLLIELLLEVRLLVMILVIP